MITEDNCHGTASGILCKIWNAVLLKVGITEIETLKVLIYNNVGNIKNVKKLKLNNLHTTLTAPAIMWKVFINNMYYYLNIKKLKFTIYVTNSENKRHKASVTFDLKKNDEDGFSSNEFLHQLWDKYFKTAKLNETIYHDIYRYCNRIENSLERNNKKSSLIKDITRKNLTWEKFNFLLVNVLEIKEFTIILDFNYDGNKYKVKKKIRIAK